MAAAERRRRRPFAATSWSRLTEGSLDAGSSGDRRLEDQRGEFFSCATAIPAHDPCRGVGSKTGPANTSNSISTHTCMSEPSSVSAAGRFTRVGTDHHPRVPPQLAA